MSSVKICLAVVVFAIMQLLWQCCSALPEPTALEYMAEVGAKIADNEGTPKDLDTAPTTVWCFADKGKHFVLIACMQYQQIIIGHCSLIDLFFFVAVVDGEHRAKPTGEGGKCGAIGRFLFNWESVANTMSVALNKSIIRPYLEVINRLIENEEVVPVNISVSLQLFHKNMTVDNSSNTTTNTSFQLVQTINITRESNGWLELDLSPSILSIWSPTCKQLPIIEVTLRMEVDCIHHKKVPFQFINPAEVELFKTFRREKHTKLQSLLVVYLEDQVIKQKLQEEDILKVEEVKEAIDGADISKTTRPKENRRRRRQTDKPTCKPKDFSISFNQLLLDNILWPRVINIRQCVGDCSHHGIAQHNDGTNHARIISSAKHLNDINGFRPPRNGTFSMEDQPHKDPCCTPIRYSSVYIVRVIDKDIMVHLFPNMKVTECSCR